MARNPVQFQKGISLSEFFALYATEDQCFDALYRWRWPNGFQCPHCGHDRVCQLTTRKLQQCHRCRRQTSVTAGAIFDSTKLALTVWFQAIYLITQDKKGLSAMKLHRLAAEAEQHARLDRPCAHRIAAVGLHEHHRLREHLSRLDDFDDLPAAARRPAASSFDRGGESSVRAAARRRTARTRSGAPGPTTRRTTS